MEKYANMHGYTDITPHEVVRVVSPKTLEIREMDAVRSNPEDNLDFSPGGFVGHHASQHRQEWTITSNENNKIFRIRLGKKGWKDKWGNKYFLRDKPIKFYDYNF